MEQQPFDNYKPDLFPRARKVAEWLFGSMTLLPKEPLASHGDHFVEHLGESQPIVNE